MTHSQGYCRILHILLILIPLLPSSSATNCRQPKCSPRGPLVQFPFSWLSNHQTASCGYPGFDLSCNNQGQTILTLPYSGDFTVQGINYREQIITMNDPNNCLPKRFLDNDVSLIDSPFLFMNGPENYTFLNCSFYEATRSAPLISCLSSEKHKVIVVPTNSLVPLDPLPYSLYCAVISTTLVPSSFDWQHLDLGAQFTWDVPDCRPCEERGLVCGLGYIGTGFGIRCFDSSNSGLSRAARYGIVIGVGIPGLLCIVGLGLYAFEKTRPGGELHQPSTELSIITNQQRPVVGIGLDRQTIESYPKTQLGESLELPEPKDNTCAICLGEYKPKTTLRTIPGCNHYFPASCVDEWLKMNATCPLCRNPPPPQSATGTSMIVSVE